MNDIDLFVATVALCDEWGGNGKGTGGQEVGNLQPTYAGCESRMYFALAAITDL